MPDPNPDPKQVGEGEEAAVRKACAAAWKAVSAASSQPDAAFEDHFDLECAPLPHRYHEAAAYASALEAVG